MKLDSLYSELTLKTDAKHVLLVLDGLGDIATREQSYLTPLEAANTPNLDALSKISAQGRMIPVAPRISICLRKQTHLDIHGSYVRDS